MSFLEPSLERQRSTLSAMVDLAVERAASASDGSVIPTMSVNELRGVLDDLDVEVPMDASVAIEWTAELLDRSLVHTTSPRYFGLFNPSPSFMGIVGDLMAAVHNPQLAVWSHAPGPVEIEAWIIRFFGERIGFGDGVGGSFTSGGQRNGVSPCSDPCFP